MIERRRRFTALAVLALLGLGGLYVEAVKNLPPLPVVDGQVLAANIVPAGINTSTDMAGNILETLPVKGRAPKTGYSRAQFGDGWASVGGCDMRDVILARDLQNVQFTSATDCSVERGTLVDDLYTGKTIQFIKGKDTSSAVQIDHVIALSDAWQKGAQALTPARRVELANDPLELIATDGPANQQKSDGDAATWLPPNKAYRCKYIARQIAVKKKYELWVTTAERDTMRRILATCPTQRLPTEMP
jgi:hypothetical protein